MSKHKDHTVTFTYTQTVCEHKNGRYNTIWTFFGIWPTTIYVCEDCQIVLHGKNLFNWERGIQ